MIPMGVMVPGYGPIEGGVGCQGFRVPGGDGPGRPRL